MIQEFSKMHLETIMKNKQNIRNVSIVSLADHGGSTLVDELGYQAGFRSESARIRFDRMDSRERERGMAYHPEAVSNLHFKYNLKSREIVQRFDRDQDEGVVICEHSHLITIVNGINAEPMPFTNQSPLLSAFDGAIVVIDVVEGWGNYGVISPLNMLLGARIRPVLFLNKLDRTLLELQLTGEEIYRQCFGIVGAVNDFIASFNYDECACPLLDPTKGSVIFGSALHGWGFSLHTFARLYASKFDTTVDKISDKLWGDWVFVNSDGHSRWVKYPTMMSSNGVDADTGSKRAFVTFVMDPIMAMVRAVMNNERNKKGDFKAFSMAKRIGATLTDDEKHLLGKPLLKAIMRKWLSLSDALLEMTVIHLPSPVTAQVYRTEVLYDGPLDDASAIAMRLCDSSDGVPLMVHISRMLYRPGQRFLAFGRVFSGKLKKGQRVNVKQRGDNQYPTTTRRKGALPETVSRILVQVGSMYEEFDEVSAGNMCLIDGIDTSILRSGTITDCISAGCIGSGKVSHQFAMYVTISVRNPTELPKLVEGMHKLAKIGDTARLFINDVGENILEGIGEEHIGRCLEILRSELLRGVELVVSEPSVIYAETVTSRSPSIKAKSPNKHCVFECAAEPLEHVACQTFDAQEMRRDMSKAQKNKVLQDKWGWSADKISQIWCFGLRDDKSTYDPNVLLNSAGKVDWINEIKDSVVMGFRHACIWGPLCNNNVREMKLILQDITSPCHAIMRGSGQISPTIRRVTSACILEASPTLLEPVYDIDVSCPLQCMDNVEAIFAARQGFICMDSRQSHPDAQYVHIRGNIPAAESLGFVTALYDVTGSTSPLVRLQFSSWRRVSGFENSPVAFRSDQTPVGRIIRNLRERHGLKLENPDFHELALLPPPSGKGARGGAACNVDISL